MHPLDFLPIAIRLFRLYLMLFIVPILLAVGAIVLIGAASAAAIVAFCFGVCVYLAAAVAGFRPSGPITHLRMDPPSKSSSGHDPAYRSYYAGPVLRDYQTVLARTFAQVWSRIIHTTHDKSTGIVRPSLVYRAQVWAAGISPRGLVTVPLALALTAGLILGAVGTIGFVAVVSTIFGLLLVLLVSGTLVAAGGARLVESAVLQIRGITIECGRCNMRATRPVYRCRRCDAAHRRLLPGLSGVLRRTCRCGEKLPTLLVAGKATLTAQCQECGAQLPDKAGLTPIVHIPIVAGPAAGKSVYMQLAINRLMLRDDGFKFGDDETKAEFERNLRLDVIEDPSRAAKTVNSRPRAHTWYVGKKRTRRLLYLYDPAGESFENNEQLADAQYLTHTKGVIFIVDPFALRQVRSKTDRTVLERMRASSTAPKEVLERFSEALRERVPPGKSNRMDIQVAVVLTKTDGLLDSTVPAHPYASIESPTRPVRDSAARDWLASMGHPDLVSSLDNQFTAVSYFAVSHLDAHEVAEHKSAHGTVTNDDPAEPLLWLLNDETRTARTP